MIIGNVDAKDLVKDDALATIDLKELGIDETHREAILKVCQELGKQGLTIKVK